jgi:hypothetical protein
MFYQNIPKATTLTKNYLDSLKLHASLLNFFTTDCSYFVLELFVQGVGTNYLTTEASNLKEYRTAYHFASALINNFRNPDFDYMSEVEGYNDVQVLQKYASSVLKFSKL